MRVLGRPAGECRHLFAGNRQAGLAGEYKDIRDHSHMKEKPDGNESLGYVPLHTWNAKRINATETGCLFLCK